MEVAKEGLKDELLKLAGVEMDNLLETAQGIRHMSSTGGAGGVLDVFYSPFKS